MTILFLILINILLLTWACLVTYFVIKHAKILFKVEDQIIESLDILDNSYKTISKILEIPIFIGEPNIIESFNSIKRARDSILLVANKLDSSLSLDESEDDVNN